MVTLANGNSNGPADSVSPWEQFYCILYNKILKYLNKLKIADAELLDVGSNTVQRPLVFVVVVSSPHLQLVGVVEEHDGLLLPSQADEALLAEHGRHPLQEVAVAAGPFLVHVHAGCWLLGSAQETLRLAAQ